MNTVLERIKGKVLLRPQFDNTHLGVDELKWMAVNTVKLARWWVELGDGRAGTEDAANMGLWLRCQYQIELIQREQKA
jgi:hypothetical protein